MDKPNDKNLGVCPKCGTKLVRLWGYGWDWDKAVCQERGCDYKEELDESHLVDPYGSVFVMRKQEIEEK